MKSKILKNLLKIKKRLDKKTIEELKLIRKEMLLTCEHNSQLLLDMINENKGLQNISKMDRNIFNKFNEIYKKLEVENRNE